MNKILFTILVIFTFNIGLAEDLGWDYVPSKIGSKYTYMLNTKPGKDNISNKLIKYIINCQNNQKNCIEEISFSRLNKSNIIYTSYKITSTNKGVNSIESTSNTTFKYNGIYLPKKIVFNKPIKSKSNLKTIKGDIIKYQEIDSYSKTKPIEINNKIYKNCIIKDISSSSSNGIKTSSRYIYCKNIGLVKADNTAYLKNGSKEESVMELIKIDYPFSNN